MSECSCGNEINSDRCRCRVCIEENQVLADPWCRCGSLKSRSEELCSDCRLIERDDLVDTTGDPGLSRHEWEKQHADSQYFEEQYGGGA
jgi:hypothetical protein